MLRQQLTQQEEEQQSLLYHRSIEQQDDDQRRHHNSLSSSLVAQENRHLNNHGGDGDGNDRAMRQMDSVNGSSNNKSVSYYQQHQYGATADSVLAATSSSYPGQENEEEDDIDDDDDDDDDDMSLSTSSEGDEEDDDGLFSFGSEYRDNDNSGDEDEENKGCFLFPCCDSHKQKKKRRRHSNDSSTDSDDPDDDDDEERQESKWKIFKPVISPIIKVYEVAKEAFILITNVDDVWDSPALGARGSRNDEIHIYRSTSDSLASSSTMRGRGDGTIGGSGHLLHDGAGTFQRHSSTSASHHVIEGANHRDIGQYVSFRHKVGVLFWFLVLATAYASERGTFKVMYVNFQNTRLTCFSRIFIYTQEEMIFILVHSLLCCLFILLLFAKRVDRMGPFRMVVGAEIVMAVHALILAVWMFIRSITCGRENAKGTAMLPLADIGCKLFLYKFLKKNSSNVTL